MSFETQDNLESGLRKMTEWDGAAPGLWTGALERTRVKKVRRPVGLLLRRVPGWAAGAVAAAVVLVAGTMLWPAQQAARSRSSLDAMNRALESFAAGRDQDREKAAGGESARWKSSDIPEVERQTSEGGAVYGNPRHRDGGGGRSTAASQPTDESGERMVVRKATIELVVEDVSAAFLKAQQAVSEAGGEFVQDSTNKGSGKTAEASLTLRVGAERLHAVLNELRKLGKVNAENVSGEDVTAQVVDTDARLRNERRVEEELLKLFDQKQSSPLNEVLQLRDKLSAVRQTIEQLTAQRERLGRLVSLASVLVIIRPADAPVPTPKMETLWEHFGERMAAGARSGVLYLMDSLAGLVAFLLGGLMWWVAAGVVGALVWRGVRKARAVAR